MIRESEPQVQRKSGFFTDVVKKGGLVQTESSMEVRHKDLPKLFLRHKPK